LLKDDGVMQRHSIGRSDGPGFTYPWIAKYIFPGGCLPALSKVLPLTNAPDFSGTTSKSCGCMTPRGSKPGARTS
jgi:cyclopropane fatty-acyl-phospholipid synthase-like methyltransferase